MLGRRGVAAGGVLADGQAPVRRQGAARGRRRCERGARRAPELYDPKTGISYYLWRLLIDERFQGRGYGAATIDAVVAYLRTRPGADLLWTSCRAGPGSPQPFYLHYGFVLTGDVKLGEDLLRLDLRDGAGQAADRSP